MKGAEEPRSILDIKKAHRQNAFLQTRGVKKHLRERPNECMFVQSDFVDSFDVLLVCLRREVPKIVLERAPDPSSTSFKDKAI